MPARCVAITTAEGGARQPARQTLACTVSGHVRVLLHLCFVSAVLAATLADTLAAQPRSLSSARHKLDVFGSRTCVARMHGARAYGTVHGCR